MQIHPQLGAEENLRRKRKSRAKRHLAWEQLIENGGSKYAEHFTALARQYPMLTPMELRVCALIKSQLPNWIIAQRLCTTEKTIENHRNSIRKKLGLSPTQNLQLTLYIH